ncbi:hypothetical protein UZ36_03800 [Candidatus Nitromaritima sp. SCGC AAA799-C22]|nr:hypothetical protein UZ36_03800 [Candidatus Nitromaritima sp. SCGC AAA799-C22]
MNFKVVKVVLSRFVMVGLSLSFFIGVGAVPDSLTGQAWALSSESMPLTSNIFVDIAKKQNPAVVNVSMKARARNHSRAPLPPGSPGSPDQRDPFRDFYDRFFGERPDSQPKRGMGSGFIIDPDGTKKHPEMH